MNGDPYARHHRHSSHPGFSQLLTTVLGSPFLTTEELVDGSSTSVPFNQTITRPSSPTPTVDSSSFSFIQTDYDPAASVPNRLPLKSILPRIWDVLSPSRTPPSPTGYPYNHSYGYGSFKSRIKTRAHIGDYSQDIDYSELAPLDGEEGELVDEACFFVDSVLGSRAVTGIDILALLPTELALHILVLLCTSPTSPDESLHAILTCGAVSRTWRTLAVDNTVWRALFLMRWNVDLTRHKRLRPKLSPLIPFTPSFPFYSPAWWESAIPIQQTSTPASSPAKPGKMRAGIMTIKKRKMKKLLTSDSSPSFFHSPSTSLSTPSSSSSSLPSTRTLARHPHHFYTTPPSLGCSHHFASSSPSTPSATYSLSNGYLGHNHIPAPPLIQHPRIASAPGDLNRNSVTKPTSTHSQEPNKELTYAPLRVNWYALYQTRLELERRWNGTAIIKPHSATPTEISPPTHLNHFQQYNRNLYPITNPFLSQPSPYSYMPITSYNSLQPPSERPKAFSPKILSIEGHTDSVYCLEFDGRRIVTGSRDRTIKVWSLRNGRLLGNFGAGVNNTTADVGASLYQGVGTGLGMGNGQVTVHTVKQGQVQGHSGSVLCLKFSPDWDAHESDDDGDEIGGSSGRIVNREKRMGFMVSGSSDCSVYVWNLWTGARLPRHCGESQENAEEAYVEREVKGEVKAVLRGHAGGVLDLRIDERWIVSCSKDTVIRIWDRKTLALARTLRGHEGPVNAVGLQNGRVVSASGDGKMILWNILNGERIRTFEAHDRGLACIEFKDDLIVSGSNDKKIKVWSATTGECIRTLVGHEALVRALAFDPKSERLVSASYDRTVKVWNLGTGKLVREFKDTHTSQIFDVKFDAARVVSTSHDQKIAVIDFSQGLDTSLFI